LHIQLTELLTFRLKLFGEHTQAVRRITLLLLFFRVLELFNKLAETESVSSPFLAPQEGRVRRVLKTSLNLALVTE